jgi:2-C-methyl-D-erythritol 2,4-cyclodiphosphate synthase
VAHALADALLGAAGLGDLGEHFSDADVTVAGIASSEILRVVMGLVSAEGFSVESADLTVIAERPKIAPHRSAMSAALSRAIDAPVSVKATTTEGLGFLGRREGIAALSVVLLKEKS